MLFQLNAEQDVHQFNQLTHAIALDWQLLNAEQESPVDKPDAETPFQLNAMQDAHQLTHAIALHKQSDNAEQESPVDKPDVDMLFQLNAKQDAHQLIHVQENLALITMHVLLILAMQLPETASTPQKLAMTELHVP